MARKGNAFAAARGYGAFLEHAVYVAGKVGKFDAHGDSFSIDFQFPDRFLFRQNAFGEKKPDGKFLQFGRGAEQGDERFVVQDQPDGQFGRYLIDDAFHVIAGNFENESFAFRVHERTITWCKNVVKNSNEKASEKFRRPLQYMRFN